MNEAAMGLAPEEELPSLAEFADDIAGAWPDGWYKGTVVEGYATRNGTQFTTETSLAQRGDSYNTRICFTLVGPKAAQRFMFGSINYRTDDFSLARLEMIRDLRKQKAGTTGRWNDNPDAQRTSLAITSLGELEKALGHKVPMVNGILNPVALKGLELEVRLGPDKKNPKYQAIKHYAKLGTHTK